MDYQYIAGKFHGFLKRLVGSERFEEDRRKIISQIICLTVLNCVIIYFTSGNFHDIIKRVAHGGP
ncbi:hypothetical protein D3C81_2151770 [compost metagenome]